MTESRNKLTPEEFVLSELPDFRNDKWKPFSVANYCYTKLTETQTNGIAFPLWPNDHGAVIDAWREKHYLLLGHFFSSDCWYDNLDKKIKNYFKRHKENELKSNLPPALLHNVKIKILLHEKKREEAIELIQQSNLHLNLSGENFVNANLAKIDLEGVSLVYTQFEKANLKEANLRRATLHKANLRNADLRGADLTDAKLDGADLTGALLDENAARGILSFIENNQTHFPKKLDSLRECIINCEEKEALPRANDCIALIRLCTEYVNTAFGERDFAKALQKFNIKNLSQNFQNAFRKLLKSELEVQCQPMYKVQVKKPDYYQADEKLENKEDKIPSYSLVKDLSMAYMVNSRYLVTEFKGNEKIIWDRQKNDEQPFASLSYTEEEKDLLNPNYLLGSTIEENKEFYGATYLCSDEIIALFKVNSDGNTIFQLCYYKKDPSGFQKIKTANLSNPENEYPLTITAISQNQFAIVFSSNKIEIWNREQNSKDSLSFTCNRSFNLSNQSFPFCSEVKSGRYQLKEGWDHRCIKKMSLHNFEKHTDKIELILMNPERLEIGLHAINSDELIYIQGNRTHYQLIQKINIKTGEVTHQMENIAELSPGITSARSYYPLADGQTFLVNSSHYNGKLRYHSRQSYIFKPSTMSFYKVKGLEIESDMSYSGSTIEEVVSILNSGEIMTISYNDYSNTINISEPLPHIKAYNQNLKAYLNKQVKKQLKPYFIQDLEPMVLGYLNNDIQLTADEKMALTEDLATFYGKPEASCAGLLQRNLEDYSCLELGENKVENVDEEDLWGNPNEPEEIFEPEEEYVNDTTVEFQEDESEPKEGNLINDATDGRQEDDKENESAKSNHVISIANHPARFFATTINSTDSPIFKSRETSPSSHINSCWSPL